MSQISRTFQKMNNELKLFRIPESHRAFKLMLSLLLALAVWSGACSRNLPPVSQAKASPPAVTAGSDGGLFDEGAADHTECALKRDFKNAHPTAAELVAGLGISDAQIVPAIAGVLPSGAEIISAHRCTIKKREYLHIVIRQNNQLVSVSLTLKEGGGIAEVQSKEFSAGPTLKMHAHKSGDVEVAGIETSSHLAFISSTLPEEEHLGLSTLLGPVIKTFIARIES